MYDLPTSPINCNIKSSIVWRPLLPNLRCMQVPLTEIPSVLDLYIFDITSPGGGKLCEGYEILPEDCINRSRVREGDIKTITLVDENVVQLSDSRFICEIPGLLNLCNIEYHGNYDTEHIQKNPLRMSNSVRKKITNRVANITPSILAMELMNNSKILDTISNTLANQVQPTSTRFAPNLESIQNALKYDKKL
ncbi:hypothetical protein F8M41_008210 [Gigaspora margarita]|uniref:Uncharacterized protein n=1 Tax=Gigaspora margarita TaxID=4874 RepID=A0A8H3X4K2_GIGMA|nr:hypothetical protein F8M41_008210 [Gigaspora margarita]